MKYSRVRVFRKYFLLESQMKAGAMSCITTRSGGKSVYVCVVVGARTAVEAAGGSVDGVVETEG